MRNGRASLVIGLAVMASFAKPAYAEGTNLVGRVEARADAERTTVVVHGSAKPSFTAYRLERPSRLVVDLANGKLTQDPSHDGPMDVDSWAVGQIATAQYQTDQTRTARVMIGLKRASTYDVQPKGNDLYITITANDLPPTGASEAQAAAADARRKQVLGQLADEEKRLAALKDARAEEERRARKQGDAQKAEAEATAKAEAARMEADTAKARAIAARAEVERLRGERAIEESKIAELQRKAQAGGAKEQAQLEQIRRDAAKEQQRLTALKADAERVAMQRAADLKKIDDAQAEARALAEKRAHALDEARMIADRRASEAASLRMIEERKVQAQVDEAERLRAATNLASTENQQKAAEAAAKRAAEQAKADEARVAKLRVEAERIAKVADAARAQVDAARAEAGKLAEQQTRERAKLESARLEARSLADQRQLEIERATHASAIASGEKAKIEAAERDARRLAELRQKESARLDEVRKSTEEAATLRAEELKKVDDARAMQKATVAAHERELKMLAERRDRELRSLAEARAGEEAKIAAARDEVSKAKNELSASKAEREGLEKKIVEARAELERAKQAPVAPKKDKLAAAKVKDIRFSDDSDSHRVVIDVQGEPDWRTTPSQRGELTLRIAGAELPRRLERMLDTAAFKGPVRSVSTFTDPEDANVVKVVVALSPGYKSGEPKVTKEGDRLVWEFPREARSTSIAPVRVGGYGASIPLQVAASSLNLPNPARRRRTAYSSRRIDLDFVNFDIGNLLRFISDVGQVNIVTSDDVKGTITIRMHDVPWDQALEVVLKSKGLGQQREGNLIRVAPISVLEKEVEQEVARARASIELKPLDTRLIPLSYATGDKMLPRVQEVLSSRGKVSVDDRTNMLIVSDVASNIALAEDLVRNLDTQTPQVLIEARIVEATHNFTRQVGIQWGGNTLNSAATGNPTGLSFPSTVGVAGAGADATSPVSGLQGAAAANPNYVVNLPAPTGTGSGGGLGVTLGSLSGAYNLNLRLSALESTGEVRIVSAPKITTIDNVEASIEQGTSIPISVVSAAGTNTVFVDAKLNLTVKPHITNEGSVLMIMSLTNNAPDFVNTSANGTPTILKKQAKSEMLVRDGDTAVIGGIFTRNSGVSYQKLPWIADVPILGWLFKNKKENDDRTELLIFITPRIVQRQMVAR